MNGEQKFSVTMRPIKPISSKQSDVIVEVMASSPVRALIKARDLACQKYPELNDMTVNFLGIEQTV